MAPFSISRYFKTLCFLILYLQTLTADPNTSFYFKNFGKHIKIESNLAMYGDAKVINGGSSVQITGPSIYSAGRVMFKKPIKFLEGNPREIVSLSTYFSFSISPGNGDGLAFVMVPIGFPLNVFDVGSFGLFGERKFKALGVEFDTFMDEKLGDVNGNHVGIDFISPISVKVSNVSSINLLLNSGEILQAWIDYEAGSKQLEVRLSRLGDKRPVAPLLFYPVDFSRMWKEEQVFVGLSSSNGNSSQKCTIYSWSFKLRKAPHWLHSQPLDPEEFSEKTISPTAHKRSDCLLSVLSALMFATGCGALGVFIVLFVWKVFGNKRPILPEELAAQAVEFERKKFNVVVDKAIENGKM
ncbi:hypothetical protein LguiA_032123 [Lonicera macranthoides]